MLQLAEHLTEMRRQLSAHGLVLGCFGAVVAVSAVALEACER